MKVKVNKDACIGCGACAQYVMMFLNLMMKD